MGFEDLESGFESEPSLDTSADSSGWDELAALNEDVSDTTWDDVAALNEDVSSTTWDDVAAMNEDVSNTTWDDVAAMPEFGEEAAPDLGTELPDETAPELNDLGFEVPEESTELSPELQQMSDYMSDHDYGREDAAEYTQDPAYQELNDALCEADGLEQPDYETVSDDPQQAMYDYMAGHNYGREDVAEYSQDPEYQRLNDALCEAEGIEKPVYDTPPEDPQQAMYDYMAGHNYGREDVAEYSQDPEYQRLNDALCEAEGIEKPVYDSAETEGADDLTDDFTDDTTDDFTDDTTDDFTDDTTDDFTDDTTNDVTDDTANDVTDDTTNDVTDDGKPVEWNGETVNVPHDDVTDDTANDLTDDTANDVTDDATNDVTDDATNDVTDDTTNDLTDDTTNDLTDDTANDFTDDTANDFTDDATNDFTDDTANDLTDDGKPVEWNGETVNVPHDDFTDDTANDVTDDTANDFTDDTANDVTDDTANDFTDDTANDFTDDTANDFTDDTANDVTDDGKPVEWDGETVNVPHDDVSDAAPDAASDTPPDTPPETPPDVPEDLTGEAESDRPLLAEYDDSLFEEENKLDAPDFYESGSFYTQGVNEYGYEGTCGPTSQANAINCLLGTNEITENKVLTIAVENDLCDTSSLEVEDCGGTTTDQFCELYETVNEKIGDKLDVERFDDTSGKVLSTEEMAEKLDEGAVLNIAVDSATLWDCNDHIPGELAEDVCTDHWITVTDVQRDESGEIVGFDIIDSGGGESWADVDKFNRMCFGEEGREMLDPTCIAVSKKPEDVPAVSPPQPEDRDVVQATRHPIQ